MPSSRLIEMAHGLFETVYTHLNVYRVLGAALLVIALILVNKYFYQPTFGPLRNIPGPTDREDGWHPIFGHLGPVLASETGAASGRWIKRYGNVLRE